MKQVIEQVKYRRVDKVHKYLKASVTPFGAATTQYRRLMQRVRTVIIRQKGVLLHETSKVSD